MYFIHSVDTKCHGLGFEFWNRDLRAIVSCASSQMGQQITATRLHNESNGPELHFIGQSRKNRCLVSYLYRLIEFLIDKRQTRTYQPIGIYLLWNEQARTVLDDLHNSNKSPRYTLTTKIPSREKVFDWCKNVLLIIIIYLTLLNNIGLIHFLHF